MSISARFYTFDKKENSTKQPEGGTNYNIVLKEPCSLINPVIKLDVFNPVSFNYCYIPTFGRYYFINNWISDHGFWIAECTVDVLASFKSQILNTSQLVIRSASKRDTYIVNDYYSTTKDVDVTTNEILSGLNPFPFNTSDATYVLAVSNNDTIGKVNGIQYLALSKSQITEVMTSIFNDNNTFGFGSTEALYGLTGAVARAIIDPLQYIGECYYLPFSISSQLTTLSNFKVGFWNLTKPSGTLSSINPNYPGAPVYSKSVTLSLPQHPKSGTHGRWLNGYPYTSYDLYCGVFGTVHIDNDLIIHEFASNGSAMEVTCTVECDMFGKARLIIKKGSIILAKAYADVSVPFSLTQTKNNIIGWAGDLVGTGMSMMGGNVGSALNSVNLVNSISDAFPKPEIKGINGSALSIAEATYLQTTHKKIICEDQISTNIVGDPLGQVVSLETLTGFCQCANDLWLPLSCTANENSTIKNYLTGGFFIE